MLTLLSLARRYSEGAYRVWARELHDGSYAIVLQNAFSMEMGVKIQFTPDMIGWDKDQQFTARDLFKKEDLEGILSEVTMIVEPSDVQMIRVYKA